MTFEIKIPEVGESITEGVIVAWFKQDGELVQKDEPIFELETDKITMQVLAEISGRLSIGVAEGDVEVGQIVGSIEPNGAAASTSAAAVVESTPEEVPAEPARPLSPAVRRITAEENVDPADVTGTGKGGRITKGDVVELLERREGAAPASSAPASSAPASSAPVASVPAARPAAAAPRPVPVDAGQRETRKPLSSLRRRLAERLVDVQQNSAILTTFNEVDMSAVISLRARYKQHFVERHGVKLGFMSFFIKAVVEALQAVPGVNARIEGDEIVQNHYYDIGIAVGTEKGLVVPVLRCAESSSCAELEVQIADYGKRARERRLELSELMGGVFTISNGGVYGSMLSTPILNPPQSAILGMHAIKKRPVVIEGAGGDRIEVRPIMYLALSYDHRLIDGFEAVTFLKTIVTLLEQQPERLLFG